MMKRIGWLLLVLSFCLISVPASALSAKDRHSLYTDSEYYWGDQVKTSTCGANGTLDIATAVDSPANSTWNSGEQPPYYLEDYVINILKDTAQKLKVPESSAVTQEHVLALVAWAYAEGGNIANSGAFNIWNTGINRQDLLSTAHSASGLQSFKSFDAGVEGNAISLTQGYQSRIGKAVTQPNNTAKDVMHAIAYYDETAGNKAWAWGPSPNDPQAVLTFNHTTYIGSLLSNLSSTEKNYTNRATVVLGPGEENDHHVDASKLVYHSTNDATAAGFTGTAQAASIDANDCASSSPACQGASGNARILCDAKRYDPVSYVWGGAHGPAADWVKNCPTIGPSCGLDCSGLVNISVYDVYNVDLQENTDSELSDTTNWKKIPFTEVQPGDLIHPHDGHVEIVDHIKGDTIYTMGAHTDKYPQPRQVGPSQYTYSSGMIFQRYIGKGSNS